MTDINLLPYIMLDVRKALGAEAYLAALSLVLTIPDICGRAEYGESVGNKKRYISWYDEWIGKYEKQRDDGEAYLSGEVIYQLRCSFLHQGIPNIDKLNIKENACKIDHFRIVIVPENQFDIYADGSAIEWESGSNSRTVWYDLNMRRLCNIIIWCAEAYLRENKEKFDFFKYSIIEYGFDEEYQN